MKAKNDVKNEVSSYHQDRDCATSAGEKSSPRLVVIVIKEANNIAMHTNRAWVNVVGRIDGDYLIGVCREISEDVSIIRQTSKSVAYLFF